jgi:hypothetical protein
LVRLDLERADVNPTVHDTIITGAALVVIRRRSEVRIARIERRAARYERMRKCEASVVLQWAKPRIGVDLIARTD